VRLLPTTRILAAVAADAGRYTGDSYTIWLPERQKEIYPKPDTVLRGTILRLTFLTPIQPKDLFSVNLYHNIIHIIIIHNIFISAAASQPSARHNTSSSPRGFGGRP